MMIKVRGVNVPVDWVEIDGYLFARDRRSGQWLEPHAGPFSTGKYGVCGVCGQRPCCDPCPVQTMPDIIRYKARRAGLDEDAWLDRWAVEHDGEAWEDHYPNHTEATRLRAERRQETA